MTSSLCEISDGEKARIGCSRPQGTEEGQMMHKENSDAKHRHSSGAAIYTEISSRQCTKGCDHKEECQSQKVSASRAADLRTACSTGLVVISGLSESLFRL